MSFLVVPESGKDNKTQISISKKIWYIPVDFQGISTNSIHKMFNLSTENYTNNFTTHTHTQKKNKQNTCVCSGVVVLKPSSLFQAQKLLAGSFGLIAVPYPPRGMWNAEGWLIFFLLKKQILRKPSKKRREFWLDGFV